jgi:hypothetical protein
MHLTSAGGALLGLGSALSAAERAYLEDEFRQFSVVAGSSRVKLAGQCIWDSLVEESDLGKGAKRFRMEFIGLLRSHAASGSQRLCCKHHEDQLEVLKIKIATRQHGWLALFLDVLSSVCEDLHALLQNFRLKRRTTIRLSRFMLLDKFILAHTDIYGDRLRLSVAKEMIKRLAPECAPGERRDLLFRFQHFGEIQGRIGTFPNLRGLRRRVEDCASIKPFATLTDDVTKVSRDRSSIETVLTRLGIPFNRGDVWTELQYPAWGVGFRLAKSRFLGCPTVVDARGNWAFYPKRTKDKKYGFCRNLKNNLPGLPEVIHALHDEQFEDIIVWPKAKAGWGKGSILTK